MERSKVLIADSSLFMRTILKSQLELMNLTVAATAKDCQECLSEFLELKPGIILVDIAIAEANDFALIRAAREAVPSSSIIIMIPDQPGFPEVVVDAVRAGASGYIKKPVSPGDLKLRVSIAQRR